MARDSISEAEARQRIAAQLSSEAKTSRADYVIRTDGTVEETAAEVRAIAQRLS
jgi:dephospho-CoA kinase